MWRKIFFFLHKDCINVGSRLQWIIHRQESAEPPDGTIPRASLKNIPATDTRSSWADDSIPLSQRSKATVSQSCASFRRGWCCASNGKRSIHAKAISCLELASGNGYLGWEQCAQNAKRRMPGVLAAEKCVFFVSLFIAASTTPWSQPASWGIFVRCGWTGQAFTSPAWVRTPASWSSARGLSSSSPGLSSRPAGRQSGPAKPEKKNH